MKYDNNIRPAPRQGTTYRPKVAGISDWRGTVEFLLDTSETSGDMATGQELTIRWSVSAGQYWEGTAIVRSYNISDPLDGPVLVMAEIEGNSDLTMTP